LGELQVARRPPAFVPNESKGGRLATGHVSQRDTSGIAFRAVPFFLSLSQNPVRLASKSDFALKAPNSLYNARQIFQGIIPQKEVVNAIQGNLSSNRGISD